MTIVGGTGALLDAIAAAAPFERRARDAGRRDHRAATAASRSTTRDGDGFAARAVVVAVPLNALGAIEFAPALAGGQAARDRARSGLARDQDDDPRPRRAGRCRTRSGPVIRSATSATEELIDDGTQLLIGFGPDAERCDAGDLAAVQRELDAILPGYEALDATAHDWLADEFSRGTWAIHRPGWYEHHHAAMRRPDGPRAVRRLGPRQRLGRVHRRRDRERAAGRARGGRAERLIQGFSCARGGSGTPLASASASSSSSGRPNSSANRYGSSIGSKPRPSWSRRSCSRLGVGARVLRHRRAERRAGDPLVHALTRRRQLGRLGGAEPLRVAGVDDHRVERQLVGA